MARDLVTSPMKPVFPYFGGKARIAPQIAALFPPHRVYLEPYAGSAAVLFAKTPAPAEILNDRNGNVVTFFRVLRDRPDDLEEVLRLSPYARDEYLSCDLADDGIDDLERARRFFVRSSQSVAGIVEKRTTWSTSAAPGATRARTTVRKLDRFHLAAERLMDCIIDNRDAIDAIRLYGMTPDAVIYPDPPYLGTTRQGAGGYDTDAPGEDHHRELAAVLHETPATVVLSGYGSPLYDELYEDWQRVEIPVLERAGTTREKGSTKADRLEVLWINRRPADDLFSLMTMDTPSPKGGFRDE